MNFAKVDMKIETARFREYTMCLSEAWLEEREEVIERIREASVRGHALGSVTAPRKARAIALLVSNRPESLATLNAPRVERRVDVHEVDRLGVDRLQDLEALSL